MDRILVSRLFEFINPFERLGVPQNLPLVGELQTEFKEDDIETRDASYAPARIRYFVDQINKGAKLGPLCIDNVCGGGNIYPEPVLLDGHHRFAAAILTSTKHLMCEYGGRMDLLRYLQGRRLTAPQE